MALVNNGDLTELDVAAARLELLVDASKLAKRRKKFTLLPKFERGWR